MRELFRRRSSTPPLEVAQERDDYLPTGEGDFPIGERSFPAERLTKPEDLYEAITNGPAGDFINSMPETKDLAARQDGSRTVVVYIADKAHQLFEKNKGLIIVGAGIGASVLIFGAVHRILKHKEQAQRPGSEK